MKARVRANDVMMPKRATAVGSKSSSVGMAQTLWHQQNQPISPPPIFLIGKV
jgi:hypothetical protein